MAVAVAVAVVVAATTTMRTTATTRRHDDEHNDDSNDDNVCACANLGNKCHTAIPIIFLTKSIIDTIETQVFASKSADQKQYPTDPKQ